MYAGFKVFINHYLVGVEFNFYAIEQGFIAGNTGSDLVQGQDHFLDIRHNAVGEYKGQIAGNRILLGWDQVVAAQALLCGAAASLEVAEGLDHDPASAEHIGELRNVFAVLDGLVKGTGEVFAYQKGKIGIVCLIFL